MSEAVQPLREARKTTDSTFDRIYKFYFNKKSVVVLDKDEEHTRDRWDFAWKMLNGMYARRQVVEAMSAKYGIEKSVAYDDINKSMMLFGNPAVANKDAKRAIAEEWIVKGIKKAWDDQDLDAYERLVARYAKINKLEEEDNGLDSMLKNLKPHQVILNFKKEDLQSEAEKLRAEIIEDAEFKDITESE